jgi:hypothetical protein
MKSSIMKLKRKQCDLKISSRIFLPGHAEQTKQELNNLKGQLKQVAILLKGLKQEESQYIERMYPAERNN